MSDADLNPLPDDVQELLKADARRRPPAGFDTGVLARINRTLALPPGGESGGSGPGGIARKMGTWGTPVSIAALISGIALGVVLGKARPEGTPHAITEPAPSTPAVAAPTVESPTEEHLEPAEPAPPTARPTRHPTPAPKEAEGTDAKPQFERDTDLADERALVEIARTALAKRETTKALEAIEAHGQRFPRGQFAEERESLWIQALVNSGKAEDARRKAEEFRRAFPESMLQPAVDAALNSD